LPVTITTPGATLKAVLRVGIHAGIAFQTPSINLFGHTFSFGSGIEAGVFANVAEFVTNVTTAAGGSSGNCELQVVEYYEFAVGAAAGATVSVGTRKWGPSPNTTIAIFHTTLADACAIRGTSTPTASATAAPAASHLTTTTITTKAVYAGQACLSSGMINCPVSLQTTTIYHTTLTLTTAVPSGVSATFPPTTFASVASTIPFGSNAKSMYITSGAPTSYVPGAADFLDRKTGGVSNKVILGVSLGIGIPFVIALNAAGL
jgi:hypothetical protein